MGMPKVLALCYLTCLLVKAKLESEGTWGSDEEAAALEGSTEGILSEVLDEETVMLINDTLQHDLVNEEAKGSEESYLYEMVSWFWDDDEDDSEVTSGRSERSDDGRTVTKIVIDSMRSRYQFVADSVIGIYEAMTAEDVNYRFDLIVDEVTPP